MIMKKILLTISFLAAIISLFGQHERDQIDDRYKWDLTDIFTSDEAWNEAKLALIEKTGHIDDFKGTLTQSAGQLLEALEFTSGIRKEATRLGIYAGMHSDLDTRDMKYLGMKQEMQQILSGYAARASYMNPEILSAGWETIEGFIGEEPQLGPYTKTLKDLFRLHEHTPGEAEGKIIALSGMVYGVPGSVYNTFTNAEMPNPVVTLSTGETVTLDSPGYERCRVMPNRKDRELVFSSFFENLGDYQATLGELLYGGVKRDVYLSRAHEYGSSLEAALDRNNIPVEVYHALIENVNKNLPTFHRYLKIKQRLLGVDTLKYIDLYAPVVKDIDLSYAFDEAQEILLEALAPLGENYVQTVRKAFNERWIDVYPSKGKQSGAYSNGSYYDGHPFILLNYNDLYDDVSTTAHELGHTMQSYYSNKNQPYPTAQYPIFVAEVASTFNEVLLFDHIIKGIEDDEVKLSLLMDRLNGFKGTLFRQTQFAEFELRIHEAVEQGIPLTGKYLSELYDEIVKRYYGHDQGVCVVDDYIQMEWAFIPHFYYNYYVYQYSTSFTASISLAKSLLDGEEGSRERYLEFLSAGGSEDPIDLIRKAGVDMTGSEVFDSTISAMNELMDEIEKILDRTMK
jgi:oligoendopeptidase F